MAVNIEQFKTLMRVDFADDDAIINGYLSSVPITSRMQLERMTISMLNLLLLTVTKLLSMPMLARYTRTASV